MLNQFLSVTKAVAQQVQATVAEQSPALAQELDLPQRQRFLELLARGFDSFVHGLARATQPASSAGPNHVFEPAPRVAQAASGAILLGPQPTPSTPAGPADNPATTADDEAFAKKFAQLFLDMGGIFPKLAQVLSLRPDLIKNEQVLLKLRTVQEDCKRLPFAEAEALVMGESTGFQEGRYKLRDWPQYVYAGSIAQVSPFVLSSGENAAEEGASSTGQSVEQIPDGVVKLTFAQMRELMEIDFRLLRSQLNIMEKTGQWTRPGSRLEALQPRQMGKLKEVFRLMVQMEGEVLQEFDMRHEAECQQRGDLVLEGLLGSGDACTWLDEWRDASLQVALRPAGQTTATRAVESWRNLGPGGSARPGGGWFTRLARRAYGGRALADDLAEGEEHVKRLRSALHSLRVRVPRVHQDVGGPHVLVMDLAEGQSLKQLLDFIAREEGEAAKKAAAWFAALLLFVIVPIWGKMLLVVGCCHADPHPGNFKIDGIPGLLEPRATTTNPITPDAPPQAASPPQRRGIFSMFGCGSSQMPPQDDIVVAPPDPGVTLWILDWGSCIDLDDSIRQCLCRLVIGLSDMRTAQQRQRETPSDQSLAEVEATASRAVAACMRTLGVEATQDAAGDAFLAAVAMTLFDPSSAKDNPHLNAEGLEGLQQALPAGSGVGKVLRVVAILVGICRELERRMNDEATERMPSGSTGSSQGVRSPFVELFLVELWRPFAEEGKGDDGPS